MLHGKNTVYDLYILIRGNPQYENVIRIKTNNLTACQSGRPSKSTGLIYAAVSVLTAGNKFVSPHGQCYPERSTAMEKDQRLCKREQCTESANHAFCLM